MMMINNLKGEYFKCEKFVYEDMDTSVYQNTKTVTFFHNRFNQLIVAAIFVSTEKKVSLY